MIRKSIAITFALCGACASSTLAAVTFTSRLSTSSASFYDGSPFGYSESGSYDQLGAGTITLPHGYGNQSTVTNSGVSGAWMGSYTNYGASSGTTITKSYLDAYFTVSGPGVDAMISLNGSAFNIQLGGTNPLFQNAYFVITNTATNTVVFDAFVHGTQTIDFPSDYVAITWANVVRHVLLNAGNYRLQIGADGDNTRHPGPGGGYYGNGDLTASMTFAEVPAPGAAATILLAATTFAQRRRR